MKRPNTRQKLGRSIAKRNLRLVRNDGTSEDFVLQVAAPVRCRPDWKCMVSFEGKEYRECIAIYGVDSLQALNLAIRYLKERIESLERKLKGRFTHFGQPYSPETDWPT